MLHLFLWRLRLRILVRRTTPIAHHQPLGSRGIGEIAITGAAAAAASANAIYNATGKRARDLPITLDKIMQA
jgi:xanthine dehydrogenase YagR molybdenum-binding subunit